MRFSLIATALALALSVDATSQINRRDIRLNASRCMTSIKTISDYVPTFTKSIEKVSSYSSVLAAHSKEDKLEKKLRVAIKDCTKVTSASEEEIVAFVDVVRDLVKNIKGATDALNAKRHLLEEIPLAGPLIEDGLLTIYEDYLVIEQHLISVHPERYDDEFQSLSKEIHEAFDGSLEAYGIEH